MLKYIEMDKIWCLAFRSLELITVFLFSAKLLDYEKYLQLQKLLDESLSSASIVHQ